MTAREVVFQCRDEGSIRAPVRWLQDRNRPLPPGTTDVRGRLTIPNVQTEKSLPELTINETRVLFHHRLLSPSSLSTPFKHFSPHSHQASPAHPTKEFLISPSSPSSHLPVAFPTLPASLRSWSYKQLNTQSLNVPKASKSKIPGL
ncbi:hypothetical protein SK128_024178 [Halocaridina rubra]|uniref:Ig-like domain-containing protein n=1 Tax=Halocaridina rubra TaxID=373956 RepID=A0AAN8ZZT5_HALRR